MSSFIDKIFHRNSTDRSGQNGRPRSESDNENVVPNGKSNDGKQNSPKSSQSLAMSTGEKGKSRSHDWH